MQLQQPKGIDISTILSLTEHVYMVMLASIRLCSFTVLYLTCYAVRTITVAICVPSTDLYFKSGGIETENLVC